jgi:hypothetical protein
MGARGRRPSALRYTISSLPLFAGAAGIYWRQLEAHRGIGLRTSFDLLDMWDGGFTRILRDRRTWDGSARGLLCPKDGIEGKPIDLAAQTTAETAT